MVTPPGDREAPGLHAKTLANSSATILCGDGDRAVFLPGQREAGPARAHSFTSEGSIASGVSIALAMVLAIVPALFLGGCALPPPAEEKPLTGELEEPYQVDSTLAAADDASLEPGAPEPQESVVREDTLVIRESEGNGAAQVNPAGGEPEQASGSATEAVAAATQPPVGAGVETSSPDVTGGAEDTAVQVPAAPTGAGSAHGPDALASEMDSSGSVVISSPGDAGDAAVHVQPKVDGVAEVEVDSLEESPGEVPGKMTAEITGKELESSTREGIVEVPQSPGAELKPIADAAETLAENPIGVDKKALDRDPDAAPAVGGEEVLEPKDLQGTADATASAAPFEASDGDAEPGAIATRQHTTDDGFEMTYDVGSRAVAPLDQTGDEPARAPSVVFIHGWCGNRSQWDSHMLALVDQYRVLKMDLLGHGDSKAQGREEWTVPRYGRDVAALIEAEDLKDVILVGHAMGGQVALDVALRMPERIDGIIGVESLHELNVSKQPDNEDAEFEAFVKSFEDDFAGAYRGFVESAVHGETSKAVRDDIVADARSCDANVAVKLMRHFRTRDLKRVVRNVECPVYCINSTVIETDVEGNRVLLTGFDATSMENVGYWPHVELPEDFLSQLVSRLKGFDEPLQALEPAALTALWPVLYAKDVEVLEVFYRERLGFKVLGRLPADPSQPASLVTLERDGQRIGLQSLATLAGDLPGVSGVNEGGQVLHLTVTNLASERERVGSEAEWVVSIRTLDSGSSQAILRDPVKNVVVLQQLSKSPLGQD